MKLPKHHESDPQSCSAVQEELLAAVADSRAGRTSAVEGHLESCVSCRAAARSLESLDHRLRAGFAQLDHAIPLPSEDAIVRLLRRFEPPVEVQRLRAIRRSVKRLLWMAFFLLSLLGGCALLAFAYRALFLRGEG